VPRPALALVLVAAAAALAVLPAEASASELVGRNAAHVRLAVDAHGRALVTYRAAGVGHRVLAWGAVNARAPSRQRRQVAFRLDRSATVSIPNTCRPYDGPSLPWLVVACKAPDNSYWALQSWQRRLPNYGLSATPDRAAWELRLSHWTGAPARLEIGLDWAYRRYDHLYGRLTYSGRPVHGFRATPTGQPLDTYGRNIYVDTLDASYGPGWRRENSFLAQMGTGAFCYGFFPHSGRPEGRGPRYRATVIGPGVTPDVGWEGSAPGAYDPARDAAANARQRALYRGTGHCKVN
jgi:hypothetical protein